VVYSSTIYHGAAKPESLLGLLPGYLGMVLAGELMKFLLPSKKTEGENEAELAYVGEISATFWKLSCLHFFASILIGYAISLSGSSLFQVCYSIGPIFAAILQYIIMGKTISIIQAGAILMIVSGLAALVLLKPQDDPQNLDSASTAVRPEVLLGIAFTFATSFSYNLCNTISQVRILILLM